MEEKKRGFIIYLFMWLVIIFSYFSPLPSSEEKTLPPAPETKEAELKPSPASGDLLIISSQPEEAPEEGPEAPGLSITAYVVQEGDTLESIAQLFGLKTSTVIGTNNPSDTAELKEGTVLRIPDRDGFYVHVNEFDTIELFSQAYGAEKSDIIEANSLADANLEGITELFIPGAEPVAVIETEREGETAFSSVGEKGAGVFYSDALIYPLTAEISSPFGIRIDPFTGKARRHDGIDLPAEEGTTVHASGSGRVIFAGTMRGYGTTLVIDNGGGYSTLYAHCSELLADTDDFVKRGQPVALSGSTGRATGPHLHFEVRRNNIPEDPEFYLQK